MSEKGRGIYNVVVIGAGTAGLVTAAGTAGLGGRVALIERNKMGGDCLNFGCVPSKALISSARLCHAISHAADWGVGAPAPNADFMRIFERMRERRAQIAPHDSQERFESLGIDVFRGEARFVSPHELEVDGVKLRAKHFVVATGTRAAVPPIEGLESVRYFTNETIFDELREKPERLLILGGGPIGCELAQAFARFGVAVTILQRGSRLLPKEDHGVSDFMRKTLASEGVTVLTDSEVKAVESAGSSFRAKIERCRHGPVGRPDGGGDAGLPDGPQGRGYNARDSASDNDHVFDALLIAAGRTPNIGKLNLEAAGVKTNKRGVEVNDFLQTSQPHIYAAGDITGRFLFTHMADFQARIVVRNILMPLQLLRQRADYSVVPWCTYTDPEIARVGLGETEAKDQHIEYDLYRQSMSDVDRAVVENATSGFAQVLTRKGTDKILGATIVAEHAGDLLQPLVLAMHAGLGLSKVAAAIHPYPTFVEVARKAGDAYSKTKLTPRAKRLFAWLYARQRT